MSSASRSWTTDESRHHGGAARWPVLARLPDVSIDLPAGGATTQPASRANEYRFDPPQLSGSTLTASASGPSTTLRSARPTASSPPHAFDRGRPLGQRGIPRRESPILPRSNPFSTQRTRLTDSVAPAVRFLTLVALFTAAGIWIQTMSRHASSPSRSAEMLKTAEQPAVAPNSSPIEHRSTSAPTSAGPLDSSPQTGARIGRAGEADFSSCGPTPVAIPLVGRPTASPPHFLVLSDERLPRVRTTDPQPAGGEDNTARDQASAQNSQSDEPPTVAQRPGFLIEIPTR
jgi:hypothetical protein